MSNRPELDAEGLEIVKWSFLSHEQQEAHPLPPKRKDRFDRANVADNLIREFMSLRKVREKLVDKYAYSESTARRDIVLAQHLWGSKNPLDKAFAAGMLWDYEVECMVKPSKDRKWGDAARFLREAKDIAGIGKPDIEDADPDKLKEPVALQPMFLPAAIGAIEMSSDERQALFQRILRKKQAQGFLDKSEEAEFTEDDGHGEAGAE
jgi:hypothetical protein